MSALLTTRTFEVTGYEASRASVVEKGESIVLFFAAPFISLTYILALPIVGLCALAWIGAKALLGWVTTATRTVLLMIVSPFIGLAFVLAVPYFCLGVLVWIGSKSLSAR